MPKPLKEAWKFVKVNDITPLASMGETKENLLPRFDPEAKRLISRILNLDPTQKPTMTGVLEAP